MSDETQLAAKLAALQDAIDSGLMEFTFDGATSKYRTLSEMREIEARLKVRLGHTEPQNNTWASSFDKGYR
jgi:hypothetical protein